MYDTCTACGKDIKDGQEMTVVTNGTVFNFGEVDYGDTERYHSTCVEVTVMDLLTEAGWDPEHLKFAEQLSQPIPTSTKTVLATKHTHAFNMACGVNCPGNFERHTPGLHQFVDVLVQLGS